VLPFGLQHNLFCVPFWKCIQRSHYWCTVRPHIFSRKLLNGFRLHLLLNVYSKIVQVDIILVCNLPDDRTEVLWLYPEERRRMLQKHSFLRTYVLLLRTTVAIDGFTSLPIKNYIFHLELFYTRMCLYFFRYKTVYDGLENRDYGRKGSAALTMRHSSIRKNCH
jgi:hypothetical protein